VRCCEVVIATCLLQCGKKISITSFNYSGWLQDSHYGSLTVSRRWCEENSQGSPQCRSLAVYVAWAVSGSG
jgi:hypothetical protein